MKKTFQNKISAKRLISRIINNNTLGEKMPVQSRRNKTTAPAKAKEAPAITAEQVQKALELKIAALEAKLTASPKTV